MTQLGLSFTPPTGDLDPPLPEMVLCISLWQPYAGLCVAGIKTLETRTWDWPYPVPSWLVIHAAQHVDRAAERRLAEKVARVPVAVREARGALVGLVLVCARSHMLAPQDEERACFYAPNREAWPLDPARARMFAQPKPMRGPQKFVRLPKADVLGLLRGGGGQ